MIGFRLGLGGALVFVPVPLELRDGDARDRVPVPNNFFEARLSARLSALAAAAEARVEGEDDSGGALLLGGGGKVILFVIGMGTGDIGYSALVSSSAVGVDGTFRSWSGFRGRVLISVVLITV